MRCTDAQRLDDGRGRRSLGLRLVLSGAALLATGAIAAAGTTLASIRAEHASVRDTRFGGGTAVLARAGSGSFLSFRNLGIGATRTGRLTIVNEGTGAGELVLSASIRSNPLSRHLRLVVVVGGRTVYRGSLAVFGSARGGRLEQGAARTFVFRVSLPSTGSAARDDALQGETVDASFRWSAAAA